MSALPKILAKFFERPGWSAPPAGNAEHSGISNKMLALSKLLPKPESVLILSTRELIGYLLEAMNAGNDTRFHPKTIRNDLNDQYSAPASGRVAERVIAALELMRHEEYAARDYADSVDPEWFVLTPKGRSVNHHRRMQEPSLILESSQPLIFISCGQGDEEKAVGKRLAELIGQQTTYVGYFAENQQSLEALSHNIFRALERCAGLVLVMHRRGLVTTRSKTFERASVWIEQEIAIAAFLQHVGARFGVIAYIQDGIEREGIRSLLQLNPIPFTSNEQVIADFEKRLGNGSFDAMIDGSKAVGKVQGPQPLLRVDAFLANEYEARTLGLPVSNVTRLVLKITNAGLAPATSIRLMLNGTGYDGKPEELGPLGPGAQPLLIPVRINGGGIPGPKSGPERISIEYENENRKVGSVDLERIPSSHPPGWRVAQSRAPQ